MRIPGMELEIVVDDLEREFTQEDIKETEQEIERILDKYYGDFEIDFRTE